MQVNFYFTFIHSKAITYFFVAVSLKMSEVKNLFLILRKILHKLLHPLRLVGETTLNERIFFLYLIKIVIPCVMLTFPRFDKVQTLVSGDRHRP